ncbi:MAG: META domain-containing protein [Inhella sp.]|jgi:uncharacterized membrane protein|nr:META domain-containing protein [Inhella sp.]
MRFLLPLLIALLGSAQAQTTAQTTAQGHEPSWQAQLGERRFDFQAADGTRFALDVDARPKPGAAPLQLGLQWQGEPLLLRSEAALCHDLKSGHPYPWRISVTLAGRVFHGCGGEPAALLQASAWQAGDAVRELRFEGDGRFSAQLACNRLQGRYRIEAGALSLMPGPMTRRACWGDGPQAAENRVLEQLQRVWAFDLDAQGRLQLRQTDGALLTLEALASTR